MRMPPRPGCRSFECVRRAWHSERHQPIRGSLIQEIFRFILHLFPFKPFSCFWLCLIFGCLGLLVKFIAVLLRRIRSGKRSSPLLFLKLKRFCILKLTLRCPFFSFGFLILYQNFYYVLLYGHFVNLSENY